MSAAIQGPLSLSELLDRPFKLIRSHAGPLLGIGLIGAISNTVMGVGITRLSEQFTADPGDLDGLLDFGGLVGGASLLSMGVTLIVTLALYQAVHELLEGRSAEIAPAYLYAIRPAHLGTALLRGLAVWIGTCLCLVPGLFAWVWLSLALPALVSEGRTGMDALRRSIALLRYNPTGTFSGSAAFTVALIGVVWWLLGAAIGIMTSLPSIAMSMVQTFQSIADGGVLTQPATPLWMLVPTQFLASLGGMLVLAWLCAAMSIVYRELVRRVEGDDLAAALEARLDPEP